MSARKKRRAAGPRRESARGRSGPTRLAIALLLLAALGGAAWLATSWRKAPWRAPEPAPAPAPTAAALADSVRAAEAAHDWTRFVAHLEHLAAITPPNAELQLALGAAWNNYVWAGGPAERHGARTSLERIFFERRALQCLDSAAALARSDDEIVRIRLMRGRIYEAMGLPLDGLAQYQYALRRIPTNPEASSRIAAVGRRLRYSNRPTEP